MTRKSLITSNNKLKKNSKKEVENKPSNHIGSTMFDALKTGFGFGIGSSIAHSVIDKVTKTENNAEPNINTFQQCINDADKPVFNSEYESESVKAYKQCLCNKFQEGVCKSYLIKLN
jgi:hypothetical protein